MRITATYDNESPHLQVMAVMHVYIAPGAAEEPACAPLPADAREQRLRADSVRLLALRVAGRARSPARFQPLYALNADLRPAPIAEPVGALETLASGATSALEGGRFQHPSIRVPLGASLTWEFRDADFHNVVLANGPWSAGAPRAALTPTPRRSRCLAPTSSSASYTP